MGSDSDWPTMRHAASALEDLAVPHESRVVSAFPLGDQEFMCRHANRMIDNWVEDYKRKQAKG